MASVAKGEWDLPMIASVATCHLTGQYCKGMASILLDQLEVVVRRVAGLPTGL